MHILFNPAFITGVMILAYTGLTILVITSGK